MGLSPLASHPCLLPVPVPWGPCCIVSCCPWEQTSDEGKAGVCFAFLGEVSEPRTYLANEVLITPGSLIG